MLQGNLVYPELESTAEQQAQTCCCHSLIISLFAHSPSSAFSLTYTHTHTHAPAHKHTRLKLIHVYAHLSCVYVLSAAIGL